MNYCGYFTNFNCQLYRVNFIADIGNTNFTEIQLAGESPFVVSYDVSDTPFEPYRGSTASINVVGDSYLFDLLTPHADGVIVELLKEVGSNQYEVEWTGYLQGNVLNQPYVSCTESFTLNANDCLKVLSYFDYTQISTLRKIQTFKDIVVHILEKVPRINHFYWAETKRDRTGSILRPYELRISEQNFFSNDPEDEEPWKMDAVLAEMCRYIGMTAVQWKDAIYFIDYQYYSAFDSISYIHYQKDEDWENPETGIIPETVVMEIVEDSYRGNNGNISMDACYNKIRVKDNFYFADLFIPDIYDDDALTNRLGEKWQSEKIEPQKTGLHFTSESDEQKHQAVYVDKKGAHLEVTDLDYHYYEKFYDNRHYNSVYRNPIISGGGNYETVWENGTAAMIEGNITGSTEVSLTDEQKAESKCITRYQGGTIVDFAHIKKETINTYAWLFNNEASNSLNFDRYLCLSTLGIPYFNGTLEAEANVHCTPYATEESRYPKIFELKRNHTCPVILDNDNSFITINGSAIWERYFKRNFINPEWKADMSAIARSESNVVSNTDIPALFFKLEIGGKYWNGTDWVTGNTCFLVHTEAKFKNAETEVYDPDKFKWDGNWNTELSILNNVDWTEFTDASGYKIPLPEGFDMNKEITFEVHVPSLLQRRSDKRGSSGLWDDGLGYYCWVKNLKLNICNRYSEQADEDVVYENEVDGYSINEMPDIDLKFTTFPGRMQLSYSNVGIRKTVSTERLDGFIDYVKEEALSNALQKPEENIVEKYYNLYSKPVKREELTLDMSFNPLQKIVDTYWNEGFVMLGNEIDYGAGSQNVSIIRIEPEHIEPEHTLSISPEQMDFTAEGGNSTLTITSNTNWTIE